MTSYVAGQRLKADFPQVDRAVYALTSSPIIQRGGESLATDKVLLVDNLFFDVLQFPLVQGDPRTALAQTNNAVLTQSEARRIFGREDVVGQTLTMVTRGVATDFRITGIARDLPHNSHVRFNIVARFDLARSFTDTPQFLTSWGWQSGWYYFTLRPGADPAAIQAALPGWERRNIPDETYGNQRTNQGDNQDWLVANIRDIHLGAAQDGTMTPGNDRQTIITFAIIAFLILGMACVNFTNLATARASQRAREVALRKVLGANRAQLITQFLAESVLIACIAMLLALALVELLLPPFANFLDATLAMHYFGWDGMLLPIVGLTLLVGAAGGLYPAFYLSRFQPAQVLKANKSSAEAAGSGLLRNVLVVAQFAVSIGLIICTAIVYSQTVHARSVDPGFRREGILQIGNMDRRQIAPMAETVARQIARVPGVISVARTAIGVSTASTMGRAVTVPGRADPINIGNYAVDENFFATMGIDRIAGRTFDAARPLDRIDAPFTVSPEDQAAMIRRGGNVVVNEIAARRLGFGRPADAVGRQVRVALYPFGAGSSPVPVTIVGVVRDTRFRSIRTPIEPIMYRLGTDYQAYLDVRYDAASPGQVRERIERLWRRLAPDVPFDGQYSGEIVAELYTAEEARAETFAGFALLAALVACLGLFGLAAFTAERRTKEIGIRKVLGARSTDIVRLLVWQFTKPVIVANLIAWPVAWWVMRDWLNTFDARIDLGPTPFVAAGLLAFLVAGVTIAGHAVKVARTNPILALRYE
jgi:putative ABC transport system permease protein